MADLYIPGNLTRRQTHQIIRIAERKGVGVQFLPKLVNMTNDDAEALVKLGYVERASVTFTGTTYRLTEQAQPVIDANN
jgi:DNA repair photolyase